MCFPENRSSRMDLLLPVISILSNLEAATMGIIEGTKHLAYELARVQHHEVQEPNENFPHYRIRS